MHIQCCSGLQRARPQESQEVTPIGFSFAACSYTQFQKDPTPTFVFTAVLADVCTTMSASTAVTWFMSMYGG